MNNAIFSICADMLISRYFGLRSRIGPQWTLGSGHWLKPIVAIAKQRRWQKRDIPPKAYGHFAQGFASPLRHAAAEAAQRRHRRELPRNRNGGTPRPHRKGRIFLKSRAVYGEWPCTC